MPSFDSDDLQNNNCGSDVCGGQHQHLGMPVIDEVFHINVDQLFVLLFTDSDIFRKFIDLRQTYDVELEPWPEYPDKDGNKVRNIKYTLSINYTIGPKSSPSQEAQILYPESKPGYCYLVDADCHNGGVPYASNFYTKVQYCMRKLTEEKTRVIITGQVVYKKNTWPFIRNLIDKTASSGVAASFSVMAKLLREESDRRERGLSSNSFSQSDWRSERNPAHRDKRSSEDVILRRPNRRTNRNNYSDNKEHRIKPSRHDNLDEPTNSNFASFNEVLAKIVFVVVLALVIVNILLFYQITSLESTVAKAVTRYNLENALL